ncbi:hypothetical protein CHUAL_008010 [Chamberlinius hualienensis]
MFETKDILNLLLAPYFCAQYYGWIGILKCWLLAIPNSQQETFELLDKYQSSNLIDPLNYIIGERVFIFNGKEDILINPANGPHIETFYQRYNCNILTEFNVSAQHTMPTKSYGNPCWAFWPPFIGNCDYDTAYITLNHIYGNLKKPTNKPAQIKENLMQFNQYEFYADLPNPSSMDTIGYIYVPTYCQTNRGCSIHIAFHGCAMGRQIIGERFVRHAGYNDVAELNNIIILYPQVAISLFIPFNPIGCYDWFGFTGEHYATQFGVQMLTVRNMLSRTLS